MSIVIAPLAVGAILGGMAAWGLGLLAGAFVAVAGAIGLMWLAWEGL
jgi:hypothetical protein